MFKDRTKALRHKADATVAQAATVDRDSAVAGWGSAAVVAASMVVTAV